MIALSVGKDHYAWKHPLNAAVLRRERMREKGEKILSGSAALLTLLFAVLFLIESFVFNSGERLLSLAFWQQPNIGLAGFWGAILGGLFLWYRGVYAENRFLMLPTYDAAELAAATIASWSEESKDIRPFLNASGQATLEEAFVTAERFSHPTVEPLHLFVGALGSTDAAVIFGRLGLAFDDVKDPLSRRLASLPSGTVTEFGDAAKTVITQALLLSLQHGRQHLVSGEIMVAAFQADPFLQELFESKKIDAQAFQNVISWLRISDRLYERYQLFRRAAAHKPVGAMNRAYTSIATPLLDSFSEDLTRDAAYGRLPMLVGRDQEVNQVLRAIEGGQQSVILVGERGVGKRSVIEGIAQLMVEERVPRSLQDKRLVRLSLPHIVSGSAGTEAESRLLRAMREIAMSGNIITVIENIDQMIGEGLDLSAALAQELEQGYTFVIATATPLEYTSKVERSQIGAAMVKIVLEEPDTNATIQILEAKVAAIENTHQVIFTYQAVAALVDLSSRYLHEAFLPQKAIEVAEEVALAVRNAKGVRGRVNAEDVANVISEKSHVPVTEVGDQEKETLLHMEERLHARVIGQDEAVKAIASALRRARADVRSHSRPIANFLFLGPTGVGKTELAKTVSEVYFGREESMLRFDMSEYQEVNSTERLIGGAGQNGLLTEAVRRAPFSLLLLDELEKAHPDVLNLFLQVMDDGRLTDGTGRTIDFTNVILIATSNAGAQYVMEAVQAEKPMAEIQNHLLEEELKQTFRPEFLNRFDGIIVFKPLTIDDVVQIAYLLIAKVSERLEVKGMHFRASDAAVYQLAKKGFDPKFGARPLRRVIQEDVDNAIATVLLKGEVGRRDTLVLTDKGSIVIEKAQAL